MLRAALISTSLVLASAAPILPIAPAAAAEQSASGKKCEETPARSTRRGILGGLGGAALGGLLGSNRVTGTISSFLPVQSLLTDVLLNLLDCDEQKKAAKATEEVTAKAEAGGAGTSVAWRSESRPGVSGKSTVKAVDTSGEGGRRCMTVEDVVIIDGEETVLPKRMCKQPPSTRYAKVA
jgi:predicted lipid-binding transport protein (Tim44 family)